MQADTSSFDRGMSTAGKGAGKLRSDVQSASAGMQSAWHSAFNLSGISGPLGGIISAVTGTFSTIKSIIMGSMAATTASFAAPTAAVVGMGANAAGSAAKMTTGFAMSGAASKVMGANVVAANAAITTSSGTATAAVSSLWAAIIAPIGIAIGLMVAFVAVLTGGGVALLAMASRGAESIGNIRLLAHEVGMTTEAMAGLERFGSGGADAFAHAMLHMQSAITEGSPRVAQAFARMNLSLSQFQGPNQDWAANLRTIAEGYSHLTSQADRANVARSLGGRAGFSMMDDLGRGAAGIDAMQARAERFGLTFSESQAQGIRAANREWSGFGMAMDGVGRQAAIMFAPAWEAIGKVGSAIGEWIVGAFRQAQPYLEQFGENAARIFGPLWEAAVNFGTAVGEIFIASFPLIEQFATLILEVGRAIMSITTLGSIDLISAAFRDTSSVSTWVDVVKDIINWLKIGVEVVTALFTAFNQIVQIVAEALWAAITVVGRAIRDAFNASGIAEWFSSLNVGGHSIKEMFLGGLAVITIALRNMGRTWDLVIDSIKIKWLELMRSMIVALPAGLQAQLGDVIPRLNVNQINRDIAQIRAGRDANLDNFGNDVRAQIQRWNFELGGGRLPGAGRINEVRRPQLPQIEVGQLRADMSHGAVGAGDERAFSLLYGNRGTQDYYARLMADRQLNAVQELRQIRNEFQNAPGIRRARL